MMDLTWSEADESFRADARRWMEQNLRTWRDRCDGSGASDGNGDGLQRDIDWAKALFDSKWSAITWPVEYGGRASSPWEWLIFEEEYYRAGGPPRITQNGISILAPALLAHGTEEQKRYILPRMAAACDIWCQGWSEPGAGSDLAGVRSAARKVDGGWLLDGQKTWTTRGAFSTHLFGLFRSDATQQRHEGLTYLMVPLDIPGIAVRGFNRLDGDEEFAEVFFDSVFLPDSLPFGSPVLGEENSGWHVAMSSTTSERGLTLRSPGRFIATADRLLSLWKGEEEAHGSSSLVPRLVDAWMKAQAYQLHTLQTITASIDGTPPGAESSLVKLWWSELDVEMNDLALDVLGSDAEVDNDWSRGWQFSLSGPIYAGTNEIQRNIAAERVLGLPRSR